MVTCPHCRKEVSRLAVEPIVLQRPLRSGMRTGDQMQAAEAWCCEHCLAPLHIERGAAG